MEHQKLLTLLNKPNDSKFVTRKWNIANDNSKATYNAAYETTYNTEVLKSYLCGYNDPYNLVIGDVTITENAQTQVSFKNCAPLLTVSQKLMEQ